MRDNIAKFINNAATQITGESSNDGLNEYGFYFDKTYFNYDEGWGYVFHEDGSVDYVFENGYVYMYEPSGSLSYSDKCVSGVINPTYFSSDGKSLGGGLWVLKE